MSIPALLIQWPNVKDWGWGSLIVDHNREDCRRVPGSVNIKRLSIKSWSTKAVTQNLNKFIRPYPTLHIFFSTSQNSLPRLHYELRSKRKCWFSRILDNVSQWNGMSIPALLIQWPNTINTHFWVLVECNVAITIISVPTGAQTHDFAIIMSRTGDGEAW
jgi:hypothetical protein